MVTKACKFVYNDIPSSKYGLTISSDDSNSNTGANLTLITDKPNRALKHELLAVDRSTPLIFTMLLTSERELRPIDLNVIISWLTGSGDYQKLQFMQNDLKYFYFNCKFTQVEVLYYANKARQLRVTIQCDSSTAWTWKKIKTLKYPKGGVNTYKLYNIGSLQIVSNPIITLKLANATTSFSIENKSIKGNIMKFNGLRSGERLYVNCETKEIIPLDRPQEYIMNTFNHKFLKLKENENILEITGGIDTLDIEYNLPVSIGG